MNYIKNIFFLKLIIFTLICNCQNLIPNSGFEDFISEYWPYPPFPCEEALHASEWKFATFMPQVPYPHYFTCFANYCTDMNYPIPYQGVPIHSWNSSHNTLNGYYFQEAMEGCAYIGFMIVNFAALYGVNQRQYPHVQLLDSLKIGHQYCLSFWISIPDVWYFMRCNTIGAFFSTFPIEMPNYYKVLPYIPQIENMKADYPDTSNIWYLVSGSFVADSNYKYLTIGNFRPDSLSDFIVDFLPGSYSEGFGLYMDMVALYDCTGHTYKANAGGSRQVCYGEPVRIGTDEPPASNSRQYFWSPATGLSDTSAARPFATPTETTTFYLRVIDEYVQESFDTITLEVVHCDIFIPNIFSPNNDNLNDVLYVRGEGIAQLSFVVFNRWGEKVFESNDPHQGWDGKFKGKQAETGVYVYMVNVTLENGMTVKRSGNVTLVR